MIFTKSQRGARLIIHNDYVYNFKEYAEGKTIWRCKNRK